MLKKFLITVKEVKVKINYIYTHIYICVYVCRYIYIIHKYTYIYIFKYTLKSNTMLDCTGMKAYVTILSVNGTLSGQAVIQ